MVRDYTKWDDTPVSLSHFAESAVRAYKIAMTPPMGPVVLVADAVLQEEPIPEIRAAQPARPEADARRAAGRRSRCRSRKPRALLVAAENPVIVAGRCARGRRRARSCWSSSPRRCRRRCTIGRRCRMNFPTPPSALRRRQHRRGGRRARARGARFLERTHAQTPVNRIGMEARPLRSLARRSSRFPRAICCRRATTRTSARYAEVDLAIAARRRSHLPALIEACKRLITQRSEAARSSARGAKLAEAAKRAAQETLEQAAWGWDASPITTARLSAEIWNADQERRLVAGVGRRVPELLADAAVGLRQALSVHRRAGRVRHRLRRARGGRRGARQPEARPPDGEHPVRRRSELRAGRAVDRRASPHSAADDHAQQPRVPSGADVRRRTWRPARSAASTAPTSAPRSPIRTSITR